MELTSTKISCKYNRKAKICTPEKKEQAKKYRLRGWTFRRIAEKLGISESRAIHIVKGESEATIERRRQNTRKYYKANRAHCIERSYANVMLRRKNVPRYYERTLKRNRERYALKIKLDTGKTVRSYKKSGKYKKK